MAFTGTLVLGAVEQALTLYKVVPRVDVEHISIDGHLRMKRRGPDGFHIGLRTTVHDALDRAQLFHDRVSKDTHVVLEVVFTSAGLAHYTTANAGKDYQFQSMLSKRHNGGGDYDWGVWRFCQDLPLHAYNEAGTCLIASTWLDII